MQSVEAMAKGPGGPDVSKYFFKAVLAAAKGDKDRCYEIMLKVVAELDKD